MLPLTFSTILPQFEAWQAAPLQHQTLISVSQMLEIRRHASRTFRIEVFARIDRCMSWTCLQVRLGYAPWQRQMGRQNATMPLLFVARVFWIVRESNTHRFLFWRNFFCCCGREGRPVLLWLWDCFLLLVRATDRISCQPSDRSLHDWEEWHGGESAGFTQGSAFPSAGCGNGSQLSKTRFKFWPKKPQNSGFFRILWPKRRFLVGRVGTVYNCSVGSVQVVQLLIFLVQICWRSCSFIACLS